jgi:hypothetical protein
MMCIVCISVAGSLIAHGKEIQKLQKDREAEVKYFLAMGIEIFDIDPKEGTPCLFTVSGAMTCYSEEWTI